ncbi:hypothetical protein [Beggiatoa leptomitoformis]|uniref:Uncharacterized protein n=1 Tax=Beggiatoa leptomitoformis TaxID=288004 RepID=A0A2N9YHF3_9GAMM|nr:hypothetical protein [Beggiatoa leptomitoformis]ALG67905.1 hypothetical protein AL038_09510 [Beggiatoa leptomitoformis]AUI69829.1 hypothetical protein BLE401_14770 [Beggiatoa leptomitoformis]
MTKAKKLYAAKELKDVVISIQTDRNFFGITDRFNAAQSLYHNLLKEAQAGNIESVEKIGDALTLYLEIASEMYARSAKFRDIRDNELKDLNDLIVKFAG